MVKPVPTVCVLKMFCTLPPNTEPEDVTLTLLIVEVKAALIVIVVPVIGVSGELPPVTVVAAGMPVPTIVSPKTMFVLDATVIDVAPLDPEAVVAKVAKLLSP